MQYRSLCSAGMYTIDRNTGTTAATGTTPHSATTGCSHVCQTTGVIAGNWHYYSTGTTEGPLYHNIIQVCTWRIPIYHTIHSTHVRGMSRTMAWLTPSSAKRIGCSAQRPRARPVDPNVWCPGGCVQYYTTLLFGGPGRGRSTHFCCLR